MMGKRLSGPAGTPPDVRPDVPSQVAVETEEKGITMLHPAESERSRPLAVRDGQGAPVTCAACGCRLERHGDAWFHFSPIGGRDARGCRVACADAAHDAGGRAIALAV